MTVKLLHKREWGNDRFYPYCEISVGLLKVFKQKCLSLEQTRELKALGFKIELLEETTEI